MLNADSTFARWDASNWCFSAYSITAITDIASAVPDTIAVFVELLTAVLFVVAFVEIPVTDVTFCRAAAPPALAASALSDSVKPPAPFFSR